MTTPPPISTLATLSLVLAHFCTFRNIANNPKRTQTRTHINADTVIGWYGTVNKEFLSVFELCLALDNCGWVSGEKIQCGYPRERKTENKRANQAWQLGKTQAQSSKLCELHSSLPQVSTVPLLGYNGDLGSDKSHKIWTHKHLMKWLAGAKLEPTNFSCLDQPSLDFGLWLDRPACLSRQRTNCDTQCERRRQKSGEEDRKARS